MSVSTAPGGPGSGYMLDPRDIELNASRLSAFSHNSSASGIVLGGKEYSVGSRVGKNKQFIIGNPNTFDPHQSFDSARSSSGSTFASRKDLIETEPIEEKGYRFEEWNWQIIRLCCFIVLIGLMVILFAVTVGVAVEHTIACDNPYKWWQGSVIYSIPVPYFRDTDGNDIGDLNGLHEKLDYVKFMENEVICLSHLLPSDAPYWNLHTSFTGVDPRLGTMDDVQRAIKRAHDELKAKVILEISPYYTSIVHSWFIESTYNSASYQSNYDGFYVWRNQPDLSMSGGWEFDIYRDQYYYHYNDSTRPVLSWGNHQVREEFKDVLKYWLDQGVDGFVMRDMDKMFVHRNDDLLSAVEQWRELLDDESKEREEKILMVESKFLEKIQRDDAQTGRDLADEFRKHVDLIEVELRMGGNATYSLQNQVEAGLKLAKKNKDPWLCWRVGGLQSVLPLYRTTLQMLSMMLPGTSMMVAGQETGNLYLEEEFNPVTPPNPMIWKLEDIFPYHAGIFPQNVTTIKALKKLIVERQKEVTLRTDSEFVEDAKSNSNKKYNYKFRKLNYKWMLLERTFKRKNAYYYAGNYYSSEITEDMSFISPEGSMVTDNFEKYKDKKNLMDVELLPAHGMVYMITY